MKEKSLFGFLIDDWKKIPQNYRYLILGGVFLIFNSWLLDHWGKTEPYTFFGIDIRGSGYSIGLLLILIGFGFLILKQFSSLGKVMWYRQKYPVEKLDIDFFLVWFNGKLMLFDNKSKPKKYFHIHPLETAQNLLFVDRGFKVLTSFMPNAIKTFPANYGGEMLRLSDYKNGGSICTQQ